MSSIYSGFTWKRNINAKRLFTLAVIISTLAVLFFVKVFQSTIVNVARNDIHDGHPSSNSVTTDWDNLLDSTTLTGAQIMQYLKWSNRQSCQLVNDFGGTMRTNPSGWDGQKSVCLDPEVAPIPDQCLVYSFGIKNEWSFDEQMSAYTVAKCTPSIRPWPARITTTTIPAMSISSNGDWASGTNTTPITIGRSAHFRPSTRNCRPVTAAGSSTI